MQYLGSSIELGDDRLNENLFHVIENELEMQSILSQSLELSKDELLERINLPNSLEKVSKDKYLNSGYSREKDIIWFLDNKNQVYHFFSNFDY